MGYEAVNMSQVGVGWSLWPKKQLRGRAAWQQKNRHGGGRGPGGGVGGWTEHRMSYGEEVALGGSGEEFFLFAPRVGIFT